MNEEKQIKKRIIIFEDEDEATIEEIDNEKLKKEKEEKKEKGEKGEKGEKEEKVYGLR